MFTNRLFRRSSSLSVALLAFGISIGAVSPVVISQSALAQDSGTPASPSPAQGTTTNFSDVGADMRLMKSYCHPIST